MILKVGKMPKTAKVTLTTPLWAAKSFAAIKILKTLIPKDTAKSWGEWGTLC